MSYDPSKFFRYFVFLMIGFFIGSGMESCVDDRLLMRQAIERNYAQYNSQTGVWEWIEAKP